MTREILLEELSASNVSETYRKYIENLLKKEEQK